MAVSAHAGCFIPREFKHFESQIQQIICTTQSGKKVLLLLRGLPGSGKSTFAAILQSCTGYGIICCADDYFYDRAGNYVFDIAKLQNAHESCRGKVKNAMKNQEILVIVDNTNIEKWQMVPYAKLAQQHQYFLMLMEPNTSWRSNVHVLTEKNTHGISKSKMSELKKRYERVTVSDLLPEKFKEENRSSTENWRTGQSPRNQSESESLPQRERKPRRNGRSSYNKEQRPRETIKNDSPSSDKVQIPSETWMDAVLNFKLAALNMDDPENRMKDESKPFDTSHSRSTVLVDMESESTSNSNSCDQIHNPHNRTEQSISSMKRKKKKMNKDKLTKNDCQALFQPIRALSETHKWSELEGICFDKLTASNAEPKLLSDKTPPLTVSSVPVTSCDAETQISELDEVLLNGDCTDDLISDLGYRTVDVDLLIANSRQEETQERSDHVTMFDQDILRRVSMVQNKGTQTDTSEVSSPEHQHSPPTENNVHLENLRMIFPNSSITDLVEILEQTQGDVEWAAEICLQLEMEAAEMNQEVSSDKFEGGERNEVDMSDDQNIEEKVEINEETASPTSPWFYLSSCAAPAGLENERDPPRLSLSKEFILRAHKKYGEEYEVKDFDFEALPEELHQNWVPPDQLVKTIYCSFLEHLGLKASPPEPPDTSVSVINTDYDEDVSDDHYEADSTATPVAQSSNSQWKENDFRYIMQEEEDIEKVMNEKRKALATDTASRLKFDRLRSQYPSMAEHVLMDIFISFQFNEEITHQHLKSLGHEPVEKPSDEENEGSENENEFLRQTRRHLMESKQELIHLRDTLSLRKETLSSQLRQLMDTKVKAASPFYVGELNECDRKLQIVKEKIRQMRLAEQAHDTIDLHSFTVAEAIESVKERLERIKDSRKRVLTIYTGVGRHSQGAAKLRPAVNQFLSQKKYRYKEIRDGVFEVRL